MRNVTDLLAANLHEVFGNRDAATRRAAVERLYTEDVVFTDPEGATTGRDALADKAAALLADAPADFDFTEDGRRYAGPHTGALAWAFGPPGRPAVRGIDVITVRDGRIAALTTMFTA
ncbi:nuclear transport factor 2 family protein [Streptomyces sp. NRRL B-24085]|uniref:nuclear transport factor 2 family protein n=1 Tax=Streptomyces sp. NRRL B-24085 TaxID=1709476 RepID=UPI0006B33AF5|nr:nuclear transport factor 2 family protein [Streptomyces sp. NRRL B-24085]